MSDVDERQQHDEDVNRYLPMHLREPDLDHPLRNYAREQANKYRELADDVVANAQKVADWHRKEADRALAEAQTTKENYEKFAEEVESHAEKVAREATLELRRMHECGEACRKAREIYFGSEDDRDFIPRILQARRGDGDDAV